MLLEIEVSHKEVATIYVEVPDETNHMAFYSIENSAIIDKIIARCQPVFTPEYSDIVTEVEWVQRPGIPENGVEYIDITDLITELRSYGD